MRGRHLCKDEEERDGEINKGVDVTLEERKDRRESIDSFMEVQIRESWL